LKKKAAWETLCNKAKTIGIAFKNGKFLRDVTWQNWRKRSMVSLVYKTVSKIFPIRGRLTIGRYELASDLLLLLLYRGLIVEALKEQGNLHTDTSREKCIAS